MGSGSARPTRWLLLAVALLAALGAAVLWTQLRPRPVEAHPALWRISSGDRHAWLFGTIHAVPADAHWLSQAIADAAAESGALMLEATGLEQEQRDRSVFAALGRSGGLPPLAARLDPPDRPPLAALKRATPDALAGIDGYEDWAAALLIGAASNEAIGLSSAEAGEARFAAMFGSAGKPVLGLETVAGQLSLFDRLPPADQRALLTQAVRESADAPRLYRQLYESWARGDQAALERQFLAPLSATPYLRAVLIDQRNAAWARDIDQRLRHEQRVLFVAVGAGHLLGSTGVPARLAALGWQVRRVQ